jgi:hypothetical protein
MEDATSLVTGKEGFIEITYEHPRAINVLVDVHKVGPEARAKGMVRASIYTCADGACTSTVDSEGY